MDNSVYQARWLLASVFLGDAGLCDNGLHPGVSHDLAELAQHCPFLRLAAARQTTSVVWRAVEFGGTAEIASGTPTGQRNGNWIGKDYAC
jgi:hypothetical protein